jgi:hypothetical protein
MIFIPLMVVILLWDGLSSTHFPLAPSLAQQPVVAQPVVAQPVAALDLQLQAAA